MQTELDIASVFQVVKPGVFGTASGDVPDGSAASVLTRQALAAARERGVVLGNAKQALANKTDSVARAESLRPLLEGMSGLSARAIASELTIQGVPAARGAAWSAKTVLRVMDRLRIAAQ